MAKEMDDAKKKFGSLFGGKDEPDGDEPESDGEDDGADEEDGDEEEGGTYDLKACANDIMAAVKANDVDALEEALQELLDKAK